MDFFDVRVIDIIDIVLAAFLMYYLYKLVRGTVAINIFVGIVIIYAIWRLTELLQMELLSKILGGFLGVGMFALIVVFQQEIRKFLLMLGSTNFTARRKVFKKLKLFSIVIKRNNSLDFIKNSGDTMKMEVNQPIIESVFYKNSPLHDGAMIIEENTITATRVILPVSNDRRIPQRFGLRHRAAVGITEKTDALCLVVSEENGQISYLKEGDFVLYENLEDLKEQLEQDLD